MRDLVTKDLQCQTSGRCSKDGRAGVETCGRSAACLPEESRTSPAAVDLAPMTRTKRYASSTDVARLAGVSQSAVSRTYRPGASVSEETRRKVIEAATALDYRPSLIPQIMLTHRSRLIAVVVGGLDNPFYSAVLEQFAKRLQALDYQVLLMHTDQDHSLDGVIPRLASYRVDAVVSALPVICGEACAEALARLKVPVVSFNTPVSNGWLSSVCSRQRRCWPGCRGAFARARRAPVWLHRRPGQQRGKPGQARRLPSRLRRSGSRSR